MATVEEIFEQTEKMRELTGHIMLAWSTLLNDPNNVEFVKNELIRVGTHLATSGMPKIN